MLSATVFRLCFLAQVSYPLLDCAFSFLEILKTEDRERPTWTNGNVIDILANENYTGTYVFNMQEKSVLTPGSFKFRPKEEWGRVPNNHEALVSMEDFLKVREILDKNRFMQGKNTDYEWYKKSPLQGFARCAMRMRIYG